jgi:hypothetical protein
MRHDGNRNHGQNCDVIFLSEAARGASGRLLWRRGGHFRTALKVGFVIIQTAKSKWTTLL